MKILSATDSIFRLADSYLDYGDADNSIPFDHGVDGTGHVQDAAHWSPEPETRNRYASPEEHDRLRDYGFDKPEDEDGSYMKWHNGDKADVYRFQHAIWPNENGSWTHVKQDRNYPWPEQYVRTDHPDLTGALGEYNRYRNAQPHRYLGGE